MIEITTYLRWFLRSFALVIADIGVGPRQCARCRIEVRRALGFRIAGELRCIRCTLLMGFLLRRSLLTALVVGTALTAINQGNILLAGEYPSELLWKIPLTYLVPFFVATWGALINSRV